MVLWLLRSQSSACQTPTALGQNQNPEHIAAFGQNQKPELIAACFCPKGVVKQACKSCVLA
jgi:hypothetical protein